VEAARVISGFRGLLDAVPISNNIGMHTISCFGIGGARETIE
jgi:hypothetical protein